MYAGEDGEVCVELGYVGKALSATKVKQPDKSKAGGFPAWYGKAPVDLADLVCRLCSRSLYLVSQIYAPTHVERSLCVFGCNRAACSVRPEAWRVIRTQKPLTPDQPGKQSGDEGVPSISAADQNSCAAPSTASVAIVPPAPPIQSREGLAPAEGTWGDIDVSWDDPSVAENEWGDETSDWGTGAATEGVGDGTAIDIGALLDQRDKRLVMAQDSSQAAPVAAGAGESVFGKRSSTGPRPNVSGGSSSDRKRGPADASGSGAAILAAEDKGVGKEQPCFPARAVSFMPEPWGVESARSDDKDMKNRLRRYREQEEDRALVAALDEALGLNSGGGAGMKNRRPGSHGKEDVVASIGEKYERTPARAKAVMRFAERVSRSPQQVVRYAYGGQPLWSASDPPKEDIPRCTCGATRVFELQLMPALLLHLKVDGRADWEPPPAARGSGACDAADNPGTKKKLPLPNGVEKHATSSIPPSKSREVKCETSERPNGGDARSDISGLEHQLKGRRDVAGAGEEGSDEIDSDDVDDAETGAMVCTPPTEEERERLRVRGMDWGVVGIWCCPRSCELSCEETVVVQLPV